MDDVESNKNKSFVEQHAAVVLKLKIKAVDGKHGRTAEEQFVFRGWLQQNSEIFGCNRDLKLAGSDVFGNLV
jgi:hypothetical protein